MYKIGVNIDSNLKEILEELIDVEFFSIDECDERKILELDLVIFDLFLEKKNERIKRLKAEGLPVIVLVIKQEEFRRGRFLFKENSIYDCILKNDYFEIERVILEALEKPKRTYEIIINDPFYKAIVDSRDIEYLIYCRLSRKTEVIDKYGKVYTIKRSFSEVEECLSSIDFLFRLDRGTIVNKKLIKELDYKRECITFNSGKKLSMSRSKLKYLEENIDLFKNRIEL